MYCEPNSGTPGTYSKTSDLSETPFVSDDVDIGCMIVCLTTNKLALPAFLWHLTLPKLFKNLGWISTDWLPRLPATSSLFQITNGSTPLDRKGANLFRPIICKLLYVRMCACTDILTALSFLTTRTTKATVDDHCKLKRLLEYLYGTIDSCLVLGADDLLMAFTCLGQCVICHTWQYA